MKIKFRKGRRCECGKPGLLVKDKNGWWHLNHADSFITDGREWEIKYGQAVYEHRSWREALVDGAFSGCPDSEDPC